MNTQMLSGHPARFAVMGFLGVMGATILLAVVAQTGLVGAETAKRGLGFLVGLAAIIVGNFLPKLRPLKSSGAGTTERFAGWLLVLTGFAHIGLFAFAALQLARTLSSVIGIAAIAAIVTNLGMQVRGQSVARKVNGDEPPQARSTQKRHLGIWLIFAFVYIFSTACVMFLLGDQPWSDRLAYWMMIGFWMVYAILYARLGTQRTSA